MLNIYTIYYRKPANFNKTYYQNENRNIGCVIVKGENNLAGKTQELIAKGVEITKVVNGIGRTINF